MGTFDAPRAAEMAHDLHFIDRQPACRMARHAPALSSFGDQATRGSRMTKYKLEYIWLDGYTPVPNLRGKTQIKEFASFPTLDQLPLWGLDGSSPMRAE